MLQGQQLPCYRANSCHVTGPTVAMLQGQQLPCYRANSCHVTGPTVGADGVDNIDGYPTTDIIRF